MTKDFSYDKYPSREMTDFLSQEKERGELQRWKLAAQMGWAIALMELISFVILPWLGIL